MIENINYEDG